MKPAELWAREDISTVPAICFPEDNVGLSGILAVNVYTIRPNDQVGQAVAVDVAGGGNAIAAQVTRTLAVDDETAGASGHSGQVDRAGSGLAEHDVAAPGIGAGGRVAVHRPDNQVGQAVAVDVPAEETLKPL